MSVFATLSVPPVQSVKAHWGRQRSLRGQENIYGISANQHSAASAAALWSVLPGDPLHVWETGQSPTVLTIVFLWTCLTWTSTGCCLVLTCQQTVSVINPPYEWKYQRLFANIVSVSGLFLVTNDIRRSFPECILHTARCSLTFQAQDIPVSWLVLPLRQSIMPCVTREQLQGLLLSPEVTVQRWHLICTGSSFPHASSPAMFCAKLPTTALFFSWDFPQISLYAHPHFIFC